MNADTLSLPAGPRLPELKRRLIACDFRSFPIFRKYFQKHGKQTASARGSYSTKSLLNYDLHILVSRGTGIAYVKDAHP
jgi:hypothetical protein